MNTTLHWRIIETGLGKFIILKADTSLLWLDVDEPKARAYSQKTLAKYVTFKDGARVFAQETSGVALQLQEYVEGKRKAFSLNLELVGTPFRNPCGGPYLKSLMERRSPIKILPKSLVTPKPLAP